MTSLNTNSAAMTALQSLQMTNKNLETTQTRISTGLKVSSAQDNAAYWSIATTMKSDNKALSAVTDSLGIGSSLADVAYTGLDATKDVLDEMKKKLVAAKQPGVDRDKIQQELTQLQGQLTSISDSASFNGDNWLKIDSSASTDYATSGVTKSIVSSFNRATDGTVSVSTIDISIASSDGTATTNNIALFDTNTVAADKVGLLDKNIAAFAADGTTAVTASDFTISTLDISALTDSDDDKALLDQFISAVDTAFSSVTTAASDIGSAKSRIEIQKSFTSSLMDAIDRGVGTLVDADLTEESTRLSALQTQQQLGVQALSIANSSSQSLLSLFR